jgi:hypothetical protein
MPTTHLGKLTSFKMALHPDPADGDLVCEGLLHEPDQACSLFGNILVVHSFNVVVVQVEDRLQAERRKIQ